MEYLSSAKYCSNVFCSFSCSTLKDIPSLESQMSLTIRPIRSSDAETCGKIGYEAHKAISSAHGYPSEQPTEEYGIALVNMLLGNPNSWGVLAEMEGKLIGSIFLHKFPSSPVAVIGPLTVRDCPAFS